MTGGTCTLVAWDTTRHPGYWKTATVHRAGIEPASAAHQAATLPLCDRWVRVWVPAGSRRLESNQPNVLYPKQAAHLAPPPREYPGVELNHASDVRSVGSDPSTGACRCLGIACGNRTRVSGVRIRFPRQLEERDAGTPGIERRAGVEPGARFRCEDSNLDGWCQRPGSCHWTTPELVVEPSLGVEPSPLAYQASVPRRGHHDGNVSMQKRSWRGPESNRPQPHCKCSSPPWHMPPQGGPDEDRTRLSRSTAAHPHQRISGPGSGKISSEPGNRTLRMQFVGLRSPPGDLLARYRSSCGTAIGRVAARIVVASQGIEPCTIGV